MTRYLVGCWVVVAAVVGMARGAEFDYRAWASRADLVYDRPASRSEEGMPIGNGRMGTLVWTSPGALHMQVNRVDVFGDDSHTNSFPRAHTDYASGCAYVDVRVGGEVFAGATFRQHLSVYDGVMTAEGAGVRVRAIAWGKRDVLALEVEDTRERPEPVAVDLRMLRYALQYVRGADWDELRKRHASVVQTNAHTAESALDVRGGRIVLTQKFREDRFYCASGVAVAVVGREARAEYYNESTVRVTAAPGRGKFVILIGSAATFDPNVDIGGKAVEEVEGVPAAFEEVLADHRRAWAEYWGRSYVSMRSADGVADEVGRQYTYFLYVMGSCSRGGAYMARFGGMLWYTNGDMRSWGSLYWWANQSCYYNGLMPANRPELVGPLFEQYTRMYEACALAARQQWGSEGIWIPETTFFNGPERLPEDIAGEMRDLYLLRKPWEERSERFKRFAETKQSFASRWNWIAQGGTWDEGHWVNAMKQPPFGHVTHIFGTTAKVAYLYWLRYEYTGDERWLRERAYPVLRGTVEFYRNFPNVRRENGKYHIYHTNSNEPAWGVKDSDEDIAAIRGVTPLLLRASEVLGVDDGMRPVWREFLENLAPLPTSDMADALVSEGYAGPRVWVKGLTPAAKPGGMLPDGNTLPHWNFDLCSLENPDWETTEVARATLDAFFARRGGLSERTPAGTLSRLPIAGAQLGRSDVVKYLVPSQVRSGESERGGLPMRNRMALREGPGATECERLGRAAEALHAALLSSVPARPGEGAWIRVFPAWPEEWEAEYSLAARGGFVVTARVKDGKVGPVRIESRVGGECRVVNPWKGKDVVIERAGGRVERKTGERVVFGTAARETVVLRPG